LKNARVLLIVVLVVLFVAGCQSQSAAPKGTKIEKDKFSIVMPQGWQSMDVIGGVQLYKNSGEVFELHYRGYNMSDTESKIQTESMANQFKGTQPKQVEIKGKQFWSTSYTAGSIPQVSNLRIENGVMISIKYGGPNYTSNPDFKAILDSIVFK
jgi:hypothetical protein